MRRYIYFRKNGGMRFWRAGDLGGSLYIGKMDEASERSADTLLLGLYLLNALLLIVIAAQKYSAM